MVCGIDVDTNMGLRALGGCGHRHVLWCGVDVRHVS